MQHMPCHESAPYLGALDPTHIPYAHTWCLMSVGPEPASKEVVPGGRLQSHALADDVHLGFGLKGGALGFEGLGFRVQDFGFRV